MVVVVDGNGQVALSAAFNGTSVFSGSITPLATGPAMLTMPIADTITLATTTEWSGTITVYVSADVAFTVSVSGSRVEAAPGDTIQIPVTVTQTSGPAVFSWFEFSTLDDAPFTNYKAVSSDGKLWYKDLLSLTYYTVQTTGAGWTKTGTLSWQVRTDAPSGTWGVTIYLKVSPVDPNSDSSYIITAATVQLSGVLDLANDDIINDNIDATTLGIGIIILLFAGIIVVNANRGRRGTASPGAVLLILLVVAAAGIAFGLIDLSAEFDIDPAMLGIGILALVALLILIRQGMVPAPKSIQRFLR